MTTENHAVHVASRSASLTSLVKAVGKSDSLSQKKLQCSEMVTSSSSYQENTCEVPKPKHGSKELLSKTEGWILPLDFRYVEEKKFTKLISISDGSCKHFEGMELSDCFMEEMTLQPGTTGLATEPALLCTQHQQMVHKLWKWSFSRSCLAPQLGRPGSQPARVIVLLGVTDFRAWHEPKYAVKELEIKLAGSHKGQIENLPAREDFTARAEELTHFLSCFSLNEDTFPT